jgi:transcriptional regulator with XRE-family HTH domain
VTDEPDDLAESIGGARALAAMLRRLRADRDLTEAQLAARIERPPDYIIDLESARAVEPTLLTVALLASACEVSVSLFVASFALPLGSPLPWPREHLPHDRTRVRFAGARAFGATLRAERLRRHWSQTTLGTRAGVNRAMIGRLERGDIPLPTLLMVTQLGRAFATSTASQIAHASRLAQSFAGEIDAPRLSRMYRDRREAPADPD